MVAMLSSVQWLHQKLMRLLSHDGMGRLALTRSCVPPYDNRDCLICQIGERTSLSKVKLQQEMYAAFWGFRITFTVMLNMSGFFCDYNMSH